MKISILIATLNNINYLKILINSIIKNSTFDHEIIIHVNENKDNTIKFLKMNLVLMNIYYMLTMICIFYLNGTPFYYLKLKN